MYNEWEKDLNDIERILGRETREILEDMIDGGYIPEVNKFIEYFLFRGGYDYSRTNRKN